MERRITGDDGAYDAPVFNDPAIGADDIHHGLIVRVWSLACTVPVINVTGHGDTHERNRGGIIQMSGSLVGQPFYGTPESRPNADETRFRNPDPNDTDVDHRMTLTVAEDCEWSLVPLFTTMNFSSDKTNDAPASYDFVLADSVQIPDETWLDPTAGS